MGHWAPWAYNRGGACRIRSKSERDGVFDKERDRSVGLRSVLLYDMSCRATGNDSGESVFISARAGPALWFDYVRYW